MHAKIIFDSLVKGFGSPKQVPIKVLTQAVMGQCLEGYAKGWLWNDLQDLMVDLQNLWLDENPPINDDDDLLLDDLCLEELLELSDWYDGLAINRNHSFGESLAYA